MFDSKDVNDYDLIEDLFAVDYQNNENDEDDIDEKNDGDTVYNVYDDDKKNYQEENY